MDVYFFPRKEKPDRQANGYVLLCSSSRQGLAGIIVVSWFLHIFSLQIVMQSCSLTEQMELWLAASQPCADLFSLKRHHPSYRWAPTVIQRVATSVWAVCRLPTENNAAAAATCTQVLIFSKSNILHATHSFSRNTTCVLCDGFEIIAVLCFWGCFLLLKRLKILFSLCVFKLEHAMTEISHLIYELLADVPTVCRNKTMQN